MGFSCGLVVCGLVGGEERACEWRGWMRTARQRSSANEKRLVSQG
jgi:hypothetical protein